MLTDQQWIGWTLSGTIIFLIVCIQIGWPTVRHLRLKRPFLAYFRVNGSNDPRELIVPENSDVHIQINREASVTHDEHELIIGFDGAPDERPHIVGAENKFIAQGLARTADPTTTKSHYIDDKGNYHIKEDRILVRGHTYSSGFRIKTKTPGRYPIKIMTITDSGEGKPKHALTLIVSNETA